MVNCPLAQVASGMWQEPVVACETSEWSERHSSRLAPRVPGAASRALVPSRGAAAGRQPACSPLAGQCC